ncbi:MAG: hypothetical protein LBK83_07860 [Treponema sp.]|nr:hypothetical protein [Treponema sp.]
MTDRQEIRAKSAELAMMLYGLMGTPKQGVNPIVFDNAERSLKEVFRLAEKFEDFISKEPSSDPLKP